MPSRTVSEMQDAMMAALAENRPCRCWIISAQVLADVVASGLLTADIFDPDRHSFWGIPIEIGDPGEGRRVKLVCDEDALT
jgi:hypothetical protein